MSSNIIKIGILLAANFAYAQQAGDAVVVGRVVDSTKATIQGAAVSLTHLGTGATIQVHTDERGQYRTPSLRIGEYAISVEAAGFKKFNQRGVVLSIGDVREVDAVLEVGEVSDSVNVEAAAPLLQTSDSTVGTVINNKQIEDLPLNGRDYLQLAALSSGTIASSQGVSVGGQAGTQAAFLLDGQDNNNQQISTGHSGQKEIVKPSVDAVQEFKVVTNGYSAEYGRSSSGVVSVALKSGSNQIHGSGVRVSSQRRPGREKFLRYHEVALQEEPVWSGRRRSHHSQQDVFLWRFRDQQDPAIVHGGEHATECASEERELFHHDYGPAHRRGVRG